MHSLWRGARLWRVPGVARCIALGERLGAGLARRRDLAEEVGVAHVHRRRRAWVQPRAGRVR